MSNTTVPSLSRWPRLLPFILADVLLLAVAGVIVFRTAAPMEIWQVIASSICVALAGWFGCWPFLADQKAALKLAEQADLASTLQQIQQLETVARQIQTATSQWQTVQEHSAKIAQTAGQMTDRITAEAKTFADFLQRANDTERSTLRLEVEKLKRSEGDWLHVVVRLFDHGFALHVAAVRSGQPRLIEQITNYQMACRDAIRRVGLVPFTARPGEPFDPNVHQAADETTKPSADAVIADTIACGYTFQGQLLRAAVVAWQPASDSIAPAGTGSAVTDPTPTAPPAAVSTEQPNVPSSPAAPASAGQEMLGI